VIEKSIINYLSKEKKVWWIAQCAGKWNLIYSICAKNTRELYEVVNKFNQEFSKYILNQEMVAHVEVEVFSRSHLIGRPAVGVTWSEEIASETLDETDTKILRELSTNARASSVDIAHKLGLTERIVIYRIKDLIKRKIIVRFRPLLDLTKVGFSFYKAIIHLKNFSNEKDKKLKEYCRNLGNIFHYEKKIGPWMLEFEMDSENYEKANEQLKKMKEEFPNYIKNYELILITAEPKGELDLTRVL
jgi:DNA-binding Lrp family transcriptional regulator